ncbi:MAG: type I restriction-modification system subunit M N-terminal domain-containing protein, partial [Candidatus Peribacteria bacterium]|nr:type I restriction-modification system subunit M N-terminal domain-containing protein [Candidatus Peribacteria bacterium]
MDNKKEIERSALFQTIWRIAIELRGSVDGWDFKQYVLGMLFYRFISENLSSYINKKQNEAGEKDFDYANLDDKEAEVAKAEIVEEKGFFIYPSELFENVRKMVVGDALGTSHDAQWSRRPQGSPLQQQNMMEMGQSQVQSPQDINEILEKIFKSIESSANG